MKLLKSEQYKIVLEYFRLNENLNSFPALVSDLENHLEMPCSGLS